MISFESPHSPVVSPVAPEGDARHGGAIERRDSSGGAPAFDVFLDASRARVRAQIRQSADVSPLRMYEPSAGERSPSAAGRSPGKGAAGRATRESGQSRQAIQTERQELVTTEPSLDMKDASSLSQSTENDARVSNATQERPPESEGNSTRSISLRNRQKAAAQQADTGTARRDHAGSSPIAWIPIIPAANVPGTSSSRLEPQKQTLAEDISRWLKSQIQERLSAAAHVREPSSVWLRQASDTARNIRQSAYASSSRSTPTDTTADSESPSSAMFRKMVTGMQLRNGQRTSSAVLELDPPRLGPMRLDVNLSEGRLRVEIHTTNVEARELLNARLSELKSALSEHGIRLDDFRIMLTKSLPHIEAGSAPPMPRKTEEEPNRRSRFAAADRSDGRRDQNEKRTSATVETVTTTGR